MVDNIFWGLSEKSSLGAVSSMTFELPERLVFPPPWIGHIRFAFWVVENLRPKCLVELGTHSGNSFCAFLQAAKRLGVDGSFHAVDHWQGDDHSGGYEEAVFADLKLYVDAKYSGLANLHRMSFDEAVDLFDDGSVDLLHIDGLHTYEAIKHDFETWLPKVSSGGVVLFHDTSVLERGFGVHKLFSELADQYPGMTFEHSNGLGILYVGSLEIPASLAALFANEEGARNAFGRLGDAIIDRYEVVEFKARLSAQEADIEDSRARESETRAALDAAREEAAGLKCEITERSSSLEDALSRNAQLKDEAESLRSDIAELSRMNGFLDSQLFHMRESTSWKITSPMRWIVGAFR